MTEEDTYSSYKTYPKWDGAKASWPRFKDQFEGAIAGQSKYASYSRVLTSTTIAILGTGVASHQSDADKIKLEEKLREQDVELFKVLLTCIPTDNLGTRAYQLVRGAKNKTFKHGSFKLAWEKLIKVNEQKAKTVLDTLMAKYLTMKMEEEEDPYDFIMKMSELRRLMEENHKHKIRETVYLKDILKKLPANYRTKKSEIETAMKAGEVTDEVDMILTLGEEYSDLFPGKAETGEILQAEAKGDTALFGQFKGKCDHSMW